MMQTSFLGRILMLFLSLFLTWAPPGAAVAEDVPDFLSETGFARMKAALEDGAEIASADFSVITIGSSSGFETEDPEEIQALWDALCKIKIVSEANESMTDYYQSIRFTLADGRSYSAMFERQWLCAEDGWPNYNLSGDAEFWTLTAELTRKYESGMTETVPSVRNSEWDSLLQQYSERTGESK